MQFSRPRSYMHEAETARRNDEQTEAECRKLTSVVVEQRCQVGHCDSFWQETWRIGGHWFVHGGGRRAVPRDQQEEHGETRGPGPQFHPVRLQERHLRNRVVRFERFEFCKAAGSGLRNSGGLRGQALAATYRSHRPHHFVRPDRESHAYEGSFAPGRQGQG